jgi:hypothetical protein
VREEFDSCLAVIEEQLTECKGQCEYPIYVKGVFVCVLLLFENTIAVLARGSEG